MKKIIFLVTTALLLFVSCEGDRGPMGPPGEKGENANETRWYIKEFTVRSEQWKLVGKEHDLNSYYEYQVNFSDLTEGVFYDGLMTAYLYLNDNTIIAQLPEVIHCGDIDAHGKEYFWTETYKCDFAVGSVLFKAVFSDFLTENRPSTMKFRVVLQY